MTLGEATRKGIGKLRLPQWNEYAHVDLYLTRGWELRGAWGEAPAGNGPIYHGPWMRHYDPCSMLALKRKWDDFDVLSTWAFGNHTDFEEWKEPADYARFAAEAQPTADGD